MKNFSIASKENTDQAPAGASGTIAQMVERCFNCLFHDPGSNPGGSITDCATVKMYKRLFIRCDRRGYMGMDIEKIIKVAIGLLEEQEGVKIEYTLTRRDDDLKKNEEATA